MAWSPKSLLRQDFGMRLLAWHVLAAKHKLVLVFVLLFADLPLFWAKRTVANGFLPEEMEKKRL